MKKLVIMMVMMMVMAGISVPAQARVETYDKADEYVVNYLKDEFEELGGINLEISYIGQKEYLVWVTDPNQGVRIKAIYNAVVDDFVDATAWSADTGELLGTYNWLTGPEYTEAGNKVLAEE